MQKEKKNESENPLQITSRPLRQLTNEDMKKVVGGITGTSVNLPTSPGNTQC